MLMRADVAKILTILVACALLGAALGILFGRL